MDSFVEINCKLFTIKIELTRSQKPADQDPHCFPSESNVRPNKKIPVFRVAQPYLNLLVKPRFIFRFSGKKL